MKNKLLMSTLTICIVQATTHEKPIPVPSSLDGNPLAIDGTQIQNMCYIVKNVGNLDHGVLDHATGKKIGKYVFNGNYCTIEELANLEHQYSSWDSAQQTTYHDLLVRAKQDFIIIAEPFIEKGRSVKPATLMFLHHWAEKHNRKDSFVLKWSNQKDGEEIKAFLDEVSSFGMLHAFCVDLVSFLSDLIKSCPHAWEQFKHMKKK